MSRCRWRRPKLLLCMKLTSLLLLAATMQVSANAYSQKIDVHFNNIRLADALKEVEKRSGWRFVFSNQVLHEDIHLTFSAVGITVDSVLKRMLVNTGLKDSVMEDHLIVIKKAGTYAAIIKVTGTITDLEGRPVEGATVRVKGLKTGATTDKKGVFTLNVEEDAILEISSIGFLAQTVPVQGHSNISIILESASSKLSDVVVVGYGTQSRQKVTSAVTMIKTDQFKDAPYTDVQSAIAGRAAGVVVNFSGGEPGSVPSINIRGGEPLIGQTTPLYVIDGIIRDQTTFVNLNVNDIESVSFLKDAAATAVYGSKASAGIVLVKTKGGAFGKLIITYADNIAWNTPANFPKLISGYDKALVSNAIGESTGKGKYAAYSEAQLDTIRRGLNPELYPNTDWYNLAFRKYALQQTHSLSISGGNGPTKFYVGLGYLNQGSNYVNNAFKIDRFSYDTKVSSNFDKIGLNATFSLNGYYDYSTQPPSSSYLIFSHVVARSPFEHAFNKDGTLAGLVDHPLAEIYSPGYARTQTSFTDGNLALTWTVPQVRGLSFRVTGDYALTFNPSKTFSVLATQYNADGTVYETPPPSLSQTSNDTKAYNAEFQADYSTSFGDHTIGATFVSIVRGGSNQWFSAFRQNFPSTAIDQLFAGDAATQTNNGSASEWGEVGYVGRLKYDYAAKYMIELNGRYDGSDYFPSSKRFGFFPSISAGWVASSEKFYHNLGIDKVFSNLKFKGSFGKVGSIGGTKYAYIPQYAVTSQAYAVNGDLQNGYYEGGLTISNQNITWYSTASRDFGLEFETLKKHVSGGLDYFYTRTKNILGSPAYSYTDPLGQSLPQVLTQAATRKEGLDAFVNYNFNIGSQFKGYIGVNLTYYNYLWERTNEDSATLTNPYTRDWGVSQDYYDAMYSSRGLYQNYNDILNNPSRLTSTALALGDVWLEDTNGDGKIDSQDYRRLGKPTAARLTFGVPFGLEFKGIRLDALLQGSGNRDVYLGQYLQGAEGAARVNFEFQKDFWLSSNTGSSYPRAGTSSMNAGNNYVSSDYWLKNARFVRLKSLTLSYDVKRIWKTDLFSELSIHAGGTNLLTFSPVKKYFDPELANTNNFFYPVNRTYSVGIRASF